MHKIILLVLSESDLKSIPAAVAVLREKPAEGIWIIHNPHLGVSNEKALEGFDKDVAALEEEIKRAIAREDFDAAKAYRDQRNAKKVDRELALREGWQKVPIEKRQEAYDKLFKDFDKSVAVNVLVSVTREVYQPDQAFELMQAMKTMWPKPLVHGSYIVAWPGSLAPRRHSSNRREELRESKFFGVSKVAKELGIPSSGMSLEAIIDAIIEAEAKAA